MDDAAYPRRDGREPENLDSQPNSADERDSGEHEPDSWMDECPNEASCADALGALKLAEPSAAAEDELDLDEDAGTPKGAPPSPCRGRAAARKGRRAAAARPEAAHQHRVHRPHRRREVDDLRQHPVGAAHAQLPLGLRRRADDREVRARRQGEEPRELVPGVHHGHQRGGARAGVSYLIVAINKMDEPTCDWSQERYEAIVKGLRPFLRTCGFTEGKDLSFVPISGLLGQNLIEHVSDPSYKHYCAKAAWYPTSMPTLFGVLDALPGPKEDENAPLRIPVIDSYKDNGLVCMGKVESGVVRAGQNCVVLPNRIRAKVLNVYMESDEYSHANVGENIRVSAAHAQVRLACDDEAVTKGSVICSLEAPCPVAAEFTALISVIDLLEHRPLISSGYYCMFHAHCVAAEVKFVRLLETVDKASKRKKPNPVFVSNNSIVTAHLMLTPPACLESFARFPQLGRFTLRDEDKTIAIGKVLEILRAE